MGCMYYWSPDQWIVGPMVRRTMRHRILEYTPSSFHWLSAYHSDVTCVPWRLESPASGQFVRQLVQANKKSSFSLLSRCEGKSPAIPLKKLNSQSVGTRTSITHDGVMAWKHFRVTGPSWWESIGHWWIPLTKGLSRGALMFSLMYAWINGWTISWVTGDLTCNDAYMTIWWKNRKRVGPWTHGVLITSLLRQKDVILT